MVNEDRQDEYGDPEGNYIRAARIASLMTGKDFDASDVVNVMIAVKLARQAMRHKRDNLVDACGYIEILDKVINIPCVKGSN